MPKRLSGQLDELAQVANPRRAERRRRRKQPTLLLNGVNKITIASRLWMTLK